MYKENEELLKTLQRSDKTRVKAKHTELDARGFSIFFNRPIRVLMQCGCCGKWNEKYIKAWDTGLVVCEHCGALNETGAEVAIADDYSKYFEDNEEK